MTFLAATLAFGLCATGALAQGCHEIKFSRGASSGEVSGRVSDSAPLCFSFGSGAGQTARVQLFGSQNTCFAIVGVADCRDDYSFVTQRRPYQINVSPLMRSNGFEDFTLRLTIK
ncbi:hypothetical protein KO516_16500 [Citreicella sp. C3M06]|uniref:hypothetical protein n=1 Tax=Citreicella sp. C3M06 TaxID=2841564 RepID=UPI001C083BCE|nr:hypothetical protein [Citreicella sp. C3M06]MBU2962392.1 hypothetical protein [Citreicella sp. C3M06]